MNSCSQEIGPNNVPSECHVVNSLDAPGPLPDHGMINDAESVEVTVLAYVYGVPRSGCHVIREENSVKFWIAHNNEIIGDGHICDLQRVEIICSECRRAHSGVEFVDRTKPSPNESEGRVLGRDIGKLVDIKIYQSSRPRQLEVGNRRQV